MARGGQVTRQWRLLRALEGSKRGLKVSELRALIEDAATERTLFRDLTDLQDVGFPLESEDGRWRLLPGNAGLLAVPLRESEVLALLYAEEVLKPLQGHPAADGLSSLREKLLPMLNDLQRRYVDEAKASQLVAHKYTSLHPATAEALAAVEEAIECQQVLSLQYATPGKGSRKRRFDAYARMVHAGNLYIVGRCHERQAVIYLAARRIETAELLDDTFDVDPGFDVRKFVDEGFGVYRGTAPAQSVQLRFAKDVAHLAEELRFAEATESTTASDGSLLLRFQQSALEPLARWIAGTGGRVRVVSPLALRGMVQEIHLAGLGSSAFRPAAAVRPTGPTNQRADHE